MKKLTIEQLEENDDAIDAFQIYASTLRLGSIEYDVLTQEEFFKALAHFLSANTEGNGSESAQSAHPCPECGEKMEEVLVVDTSIEAKLRSSNTEWCCSNCGRTE